MDEVVIAAYDPSWPEVYAGEAGAIRHALGDTLVAVEHVGSTAISSLAAKPVIDIAVSVTSLAEAEAKISALESLGYDCRGENGIPGRLFFRKGLVEFRRTHHLHLVEAGHEQWTSLLAFRDYLRSHPGDVRRYEELKRALAEKFRDDRAAYSKGKTDFVQAILEKARQAIEPVEVAEYDPRWPGLFAEETPSLRSAFGGTLIALEHIGSTAVPDLAARPVIDIQAVVRTLAEASAVVPALAALGWEQGVFARDPERRLFFKKFTAERALSHHLHVYEAGHPAAMEHIVFRDILRRDPGEAQRYLELKNALARRYIHDRIAYSHAKTEYVEAVLARALG